MNMSSNAAYDNRMNMIPNAAYKSLHSTNDEPTYEYVV